MTGINPTLSGGAHSDSSSTTQSPLQNALPNVDYGTAVIHEVASYLSGADVVSLAASCRSMNQQLTMRLPTHGASPFDEAQDANPLELAFVRTEKVLESQLVQQARSATLTALCLAKSTFLTLHGNSALEHSELSEELSEDLSELVETLGEQIDSTVAQAEKRASLLAKLQMTARNGLIDPERRAEACQTLRSVIDVDNHTVFNNVMRLNTWASVLGTEAQADMRR